MAGDEQEEEREFLAELKARSGQDLGQWMAAIAAQGFAFARASRLERIHSNGGKPIYMNEPPPSAPEPMVAPPPPKRALPAPAPSARERAELEKLLTAAKGYRPLYQLLEAEVRRAVPGVAVQPRSTYIAFVAPAEFAAVTVHASELRLGLDLGDRPHDTTLQRPRMKGPGSTISHMLVLTDARQVNADLIGLIKVASGRVNG